MLQKKSYLLHAVDNVVVKCFIFSSIVSLGFGNGCKNWKLTAQIGNVSGDEKQFHYFENYSNLRE